MSTSPFPRAVKEYFLNLRKNWPLLVIGALLGFCVWSVVSGGAAMKFQGRALQEGMEFEPPSAPRFNPEEAGMALTPGFSEAPRIKRADVSPDEGTDAQQRKSKRIIIRNARVILQADETREAAEAIAGLIERWEGEGAFLVSSRVRGGRDKSAPRIEMQIRIPAVSFEEAITAITALAAEGTIPDVTQNADDVTEEYVNISARLEALKAARERLRELMSQAATTEALLQAEAQLTQREQEIDALQGRLQYLRESAALSLITVTLEPYRVSQPLPQGWSLPLRVRNAVEVLLASLRGATNLAVFLTIVVLPWAVVLLGIFFLLKRLSRLARRENDRENPAATTREKPASEPDL